MPAASRIASSSAISRRTSAAASFARGFDDAQRDLD
jgi:hypothetical protein